MSTSLDKGGRQPEQGWLAWLHLGLGIILDPRLFLGHAANYFPSLQAPSAIDGQVIALPEQTRAFCNHKDGIGMDELTTCGTRAWSRYKLFLSEERCKH